MSDEPRADLEEGRAVIRSVLERYRREQDVITTLPPGYRPLTSAANGPVAPIVTAADIARAQELSAQLVERRPPGECVAHSASVAAHVANAEAWGHITAVPAPTFQAVSWDRAPVYVGNPKNDFGQLISRLLGGWLQSVKLSWGGGRTKRLSFEVDVPSDMSYEAMVENLHKLSRELGAPKTPADSNNRRRLLKLEEEA